MSICVNVPIQASLTDTLYLHDLYNIYRISIYVIKFFGQTTRHHFVETQDRCALNLNEEYNGIKLKRLALEFHANVKLLRWFMRTRY